MSEEAYQNILKKIRSHQVGPGLIDYAMRIITHAAFVGYAVMLGLFLLEGRYRALYENILVTGVSFVAVSLMRRKIGAKRPYETMPIRPIVEKETRGDSFPSRHVFSIFIIAMAMLEQNLFLGLLFLALGLLLAILRVISGLHYPRDVVAGALMGLALGGIGFFLVFPN